MGSDLYSVRLTAYHEWTQQQALQRGLLYGRPHKEVSNFFTEKGPWLELHLSIRSIHPGVRVDWSPSFVTRVIDEGVTSWDNPEKVEHDKSPLRQLYPTLWEMSFHTNPKRPPVVFVVQAEYHPDEKAQPKAHGKEDAVDLVAFLSLKYAPNLKGRASWDSRAWPGADDPKPAPVEQQRIRRAELRPLLSSFWLTGKGLYAREPDNSWKKLGKPLWKSNWPKVFFDSDGSPLLLDDESVVRIEKDWTTTELLRVKKTGKTGLQDALVRDQQGSLWVGSYTGLVRQDLKGNTSKLTTKEGLSGNNVAALCLDAQGRVVAATPGGLSIHRGGDKWENLSGELADKGCNRLFLGDDGSLWAAGFRGVTRIAKDGALTLFKNRQGIDGMITKVVPVPGGGVWVFTYDGAFEIAPGANRAVPSEALKRVAPEGLCDVARSGDSLWLTTAHNLVLRVRAGHTPRAYHWMQPHPDPKQKLMGFSHVYPAPDGSLWHTFGAGLFLSTAAQLAALDASPPVNAEVCPANTIPAFYGPGHEVSPAPVAQADTTKTPNPGPTATSVPKPTKPAVDLTGKTVVLTGTLTMMREEAEKILQARGAIIGKSLSAKTDYLLAGAKAGSKLAKAKSLGVAVLDEDALS